jgi:hypothetical protein
VIDFEGEGVVDAPLAAVAALVGDLTTYPSWLGIVRGVEPVDGEAWLVDIGGKLGPFTRTKRLRMVRTGELRFERDEADGREHAPWVLAASADEAPGGTRVAMRLRYGGAMALPGLKPFLNEEVRRALERLQRLASRGPAQGESD